MKKERIYEFDIIRTIAAYAVIFVHVTAIAFTMYQQGSPHLLLITTLNRFLKFTTPVFIFLGGLMVHVKYKNRPFKTLPFYKDRLIRIYLPYILFSIFYYLTHMMIYNWPFSPLGLGRQLVFGTAKYHLYFIIIIAQLYLLVPLLMPLRKSKHRHLIALAALIVNLYSVFYLHFQYADRFSLKFIFPFIIGILYGTEVLTFVNRRKLKILLPIVTLLAGILYTVTFYGHYFQTMTFPSKLPTFAWFAYTNLAIFTLLLVAGQLKKVPFLRDNALKITHCSFYIYLIHPFIIDRCEGFLTSRGVLSVTLRFLFTLTVTLILSTLLAKLLKKGFERIGIS